MLLAKLIIYLLISFVLPYFFTFFNYFPCLCWLSTMPFTKIFNFILHICHIYHKPSVHRALRSERCVIDVIDDGTF